MMRYFYELYTIFICIMCIQIIQEGDVQFLSTRYNNHDETVEKKSFPGSGIGYVDVSGILGAQS